MTHAPVGATDFADRMIRWYTDDFNEDERLTTRSDQGRLEFERTQEVIHARLSAGSQVLDIGGGTGVHAAALASRGDRVVLIDPVPRHVEIARDRNLDAHVGDALNLEAVVGERRDFDAALLLGPLYHLDARADRLEALRVAARVVRPGGWIFAGAISRCMAHVFLSTVAPATRGEPGVPDSWSQLMVTGKSPGSSSGFPGAHFHTSQELADELTDADLTDVVVHGLEGPGGMALEVTRARDDAQLAAARLLAEAVDTLPGLRDLSQHLLGVARVPG